MAEPAPLPELSGVDARRFRDEVIPAYRPVVLRGLAREWPVVRAAKESPAALARYLKGFDGGRPAEVFVGSGAMKGRFFYRDDLAGFNFERRAERLSWLLDELLKLPVEDPPVALYAGAVPVPEHLPGFEAANAMPLLEGVPPRLWAGNAHLVAAHYDLSDNIAVVAGGTRRFVLIPPEQAANLYVGPLDNTPAGQPASLADVQAPDLERFPKLAEAMAAAQAAVLEPGDAIYIPALWWHSVRSIGPLNVLVNYWWNDEPADAGSPFDVLAHGLLAIAHLPPARREAWRAMFDHYVFRTGEDPAAHLPAERRGVLGASTPDLRRRIRAFLMQSLSRR